jgi:pimeloyl-ACP methyl ester carboxylesterase
MIHPNRRNWRLYAVDAPGGAPPLVFLGGGFGTVQNWSRVIRGLGGKYRTVRFDARGRGKSGGSADYSVQAAVDDIGRVIDATGIECPILVGWSYGATIAVRYAAQHLGPVRGLVLIDGAYPIAMFDEAGKQKVRTQPPEGCRRLRASPPRHRCRSCEGRSAAYRSVRVASVLGSGERSRAERSGLRDERLALPLQPTRRDRRSRPGQPHCRPSRRPVAALMCLLWRIPRRPPRCPTPALPREEHLRRHADFQRCARIARIRRRALSSSRPLWAHEWIEDPSIARRRAQRVAIQGVTSPVS